MPELEQPSAENVERATKFYGSLLTETGVMLGDDDATIDACIIRAFAWSLDEAERRGKREARNEDPETIKPMVTEDQRKASFAAISATLARGHFKPAILIETALLLAFIQDSSILYAIYTARKSEPPQGGKA